MMLKLSLVYVGNLGAVIFIVTGHPLGGKKRRKGKLCTLDTLSIQQAHCYALFNTDNKEVNEFIKKDDPLKD